MMKICLHILYFGRFMTIDAERETWYNAQSVCHNLGSELVIIDDLIERDWIATR